MFTMMATYTKGSLKTTKWMVTGSTKIERAFNIEAIGRTIREMAKEKNTILDNWYIKDSIRTVRSMAKGNIFGLMETNMRANGKITISQVMVSIHSMMGVDMKGSG